VLGRRRRHIAQTGSGSAADTAVRMRGGGNCAQLVLGHVDRKYRLADSQLDDASGADPAN